MLLCYGIPVASISIYTTNSGIERAKIRYTSTGRLHDVSSESISWVSNIWFNKTVGFNNPTVTLKV